MVIAPTHPGRFVSLLLQKGFVIAADDSVRKSQEQFDQRQDFLGQVVTKYGLPLFGVPAVVGQIQQFVSKIGVERGGEEEWKGILRAMADEFPVNALHLAAWTGPKYVVPLECDDLSAEELGRKARRFEELAVAVKKLVGRVQLYVFGMALGQGQELQVCGSLCLFFRDRAAHDRLRPTVEAIQLRCDNAVAAGLKNALRGLSPLYALTSKGEGAVYLEKVVYRAFDKTATSSKTNRWFFPFGFGLEEVAV